MAKGVEEGNRDEEIVEMHSRSSSSSSPSSPASGRNDRSPSHSPLIMSPSPPPRQRSSTTVLLRTNSRNQEEAAIPSKEDDDPTTRQINEKSTLGNEKRWRNVWRRCFNTTSSINRHRLCMDWGSTTWQSCMVEFAGSLVLTFMSIASIIACLRAGFGQPRVAVAITLFLVYTSCILATGPISGGHLNPSFSLASLLTGHMSLPRSLLYILSQSTGAVLGAGIIKFVIPSNVASRYFLGGCLLNQVVVDLDSGRLVFIGVPVEAGFLAEVIFTFLLIGVAFPFLLKHNSLYCQKSTTITPSTGTGVGVGTDTSTSTITSTSASATLVRGALIVGSVFGLLIFVSGALLSPGYSSAGMNPARCFGSAVAQGGHSLWDPQWVFWLGPMTASVLFAILYHITHWNSYPCDRSLSHSTSKPTDNIAPTQAPPSPPEVAPNSRRMDVFLHIKAMMQRPDQEEGPSNTPPSLLIQDAMDEEAPLTRGKKKESLLLPSSSPEIISFKNL